jgi:hypothetical protein
VLHRASSFVLLLSIASGCEKSHEPAPHAVPTCADSSCVDAGRFADGGIRMPTSPAASDAGARDASLSTNMIDQPDAAMARDAGTPTCNGGACSAYRVRGGFVSSTTSNAPNGLRVSEQRISGTPESCGDVHGTRLCVRGGVR